LLIMLAAQAVPPPRPPKRDGRRRFQSRRCAISRLRSLGGIWQGIEGESGFLFLRQLARHDPRRPIERTRRARTAHLRCLPSHVGRHRDEARPMGVAGNQRVILIPEIAMTDDWSFGTSRRLENAALSRRTTVPDMQPPAQLCCCEGGIARRSGRCRPVLGHQ
jgi:hypothetical protein